MKANFSNKNILITGGAGHIGANLTRVLLAKGANIRIADNLWRGKLEYLKDEDANYIIDIDDDFYKVDLSNYENCRSVMKDVDIVYHLADVVAAITFVFANEPFIWRTNVLINTNTLAAAKETGVENFIYVGAACSYPKEKQEDPNSPMLCEDDIYPANPESAYGWSKLMGEYEAELYLKYYGMNVGILRLHNVYGPYIDFSPETSQVIPSLIRKAINYPDEDFIVWGSGKQTRAFVYVDDVVNALIKCPEKGMNKGPIQIGTDKRHSIREIAERIVKISGKQIDIKFDTSKPEGDRGRAADWTRARKILDWKPKADMDEGLKLAYEWIEKQIKG